jgi:hypothetical protein
VERVESVQSLIGLPRSEVRHLALGSPSPQPSHLSELELSVPWNSTLGQQVLNNGRRDDEEQIHGAILQVYGNQPLHPRVYTQSSRRRQTLQELLNRHFLRLLTRSLPAWLAWYISANRNTNIIILRNIFIDTPT